ncbi:MAG: hypothetical protein JXB00_15875 [Bacteroidales bacterium]|nr:hypothetical protein [Bacteroidales bacterium]
MMRITIVLFYYMIVGIQLSAQGDSSNMLKYTPEFKFKEGIFVNFEQVKNNNPIPKSRILTDVGYDDPYFFDRITEGKKLFYYDQNGVKQEIPVKNIWGYSRNGVLYIAINDGFYRITIIGSICHFVANLTTYTPAYGYGYPYYNYYDYYPYGMRPATRNTTEMRQYLIDFGTGRVMEYETTTVELLLMKDPELHDEYTALKNKKKKQLKFLYIRKFNERNPLYFPK